MDSKHNKNKSRKESNELLDNIPGFESSEAEFLTDSKEEGGEFS